MRPRVTSRHPAEELAIVDDEIGECELMGIEHKRCDTESHDSDPEVDQMRHPNGQGRIQKQEESTHAKVDTRASESRIEETERYSGCGETSSCGDISSTTKSQVGQNGVGVDLR